MANFIYAPVGTLGLCDNDIKKCVELIGSKQPGRGSKLAKGKRYIRHYLAMQDIKCSGTAIKRAIQAYNKYKNHDFLVYGPEVYFFHKTLSREIIRVIIDIVVHYSDQEIRAVFGRIPLESEYVSLLYQHRIEKLKWVRRQNYYDQAEAADRLIEQFNQL